MSLRRTRFIVGTASALTATFLACTLNPQPLPPRDEFGPSSDSSADAGSFNAAPPRQDSDAAAASPEGPEGGANDGGGDGSVLDSDASDGATDARSD